MRFSNFNCASVILFEPRILSQLYTRLSHFLYLLERYKTGAISWWYSKPWNWSWFFLSLRAKNVCIQSLTIVDLLDMEDPAELFDTFHRFSSKLELMVDYLQKVPFVQYFIETNLRIIVGTRFLHLQSFSSSFGWFVHYEIQILHIFASAICQFK